MSELIAILPDIRSMHNIGSIFRTADGAGFKKIYLCGITPEPVDRLGRIRKEVSKVSLGAESSVPWEYHKTASVLINKLKKEGWLIYALEQSKGSIPLNKVAMNKEAKVALLVGNEVDGVPSSLLKKADVILDIPMLGKKESLNVSVAFGIAAYHLALFPEKR